MKNKSLYSDLTLLIVAVIWGGGFVAVKESLNGIKPFYMLSIRFLISAVLMSIIFFKHIKKTSKKDIKAGIIVGLFMFAGFAAQTVGMQYTKASIQSFLTGTNVVIVPFLYWAVSKKKPDIYSVISAFLCLCGIGLLTINGGITEINKGDILTIICAFFFAGQIVAVGQYAKDTDPIILTIVQMGFSGILSLIIALFKEPVPSALSSSAAFSIIYLCLFSTLIATLLQNLAQRHTSSSHAAIILCLESVFGSIFSIIILKESFTIHTILGSLIVFLAIITSETKLNFLKKTK